MQEGFTINIEEDNILPIPTSEYPLAANRPKNSALNISKITNFLGVEIFNWEIYLNRVLQQMKEDSI